MLVGRIIVKRSPSRSARRRTTCSPSYFVRVVVEFRRAPVDRFGIGVVLAAAGRVDGRGTDVHEPAHARRRGRARHAFGARYVHSLAQRRIGPGHRRGAVIHLVGARDQRRQRSVVVEVAGHDVAAVPVQRDAARGLFAVQRPTGRLMIRRATSSSPRNPLATVTAASGGREACCQSQPHPSHSRVPPARRCRLRTQVPPARARARLRRPPLICPLLAYAQNGGEIDLGVGGVPPERPAPLIRSPFGVGESE